MVVASNFDYSSGYIYGSIGFRGYYSFLFFSPFIFFLLLISLILQDSDPLMNIPIAKIKATLVDQYRNSEYAARAKTRSQEILSIVSTCEQVLCSKRRNIIFYVLKLKSVGTY